MPAVQTEYGERIGLPSPGNIHGSDYDTITGVCETDSPGIGFGLAVSQGAESDQGVILGGTLAGFRGISLRDVTLRGDRGDIDHYVTPNNVGVIRRGQVWALPTENVVPGDPVYFDGATGQLGKSNAGSKLGPIPGAAWMSTGSTTTVARVYLAGYETPAT